jgi:hypothetical protein
MNNSLLAGLADVSDQISIQDLNNEEFTNKLHLFQNDTSLPSSMQQIQKRLMEQQNQQLKNRSSLFNQK